MAILKCKMCGGELDVMEGVTVIECEYCGTKQTVPTSKDENLQALFNRANVLRMKSAFDKAEQLYEKIIEKDDAQAEAYWGLILCKYGIEYVEDPQTFKRIPTCHRTSFDSIIADEDYKSALAHADSVQRGIYEAEAKEIDRIQKGILELSQKEEPYDVFICYKETDNDGQRTQDSVIANDIYHQLTQEGLKVFYAAITLENKLGSTYEPCIFAALNSAKVMLAIGTKPEHFNAVWVKNEWSRFLKIMQKDRSKLLIPCYRDMDAYELPEEFAHLQAQDMSKIGFINDVIRGIKKVTEKDAPKEVVVKETVVQSEGGGNIAPLLKRIFMFLEDGDWQNANEYCEKVLDNDPECAEAYLGKLMAVMRCRKREQMGAGTQSITNSAYGMYYKKVVRFADDALKTELEGYEKEIRARIKRMQEEEEERKNEEQYKKATAMMQSASLETDIATAEACFIDVAKKFEAIKAYKDASALAKTCLEKAEIARKDKILAAGKAKMTGESASKYEAAIKSFEVIPGWKDADEQIDKCKQIIAEIKEREEKDRIEQERRAEEERIERERREEEERIKREREIKRNKKIALITTPIICVIIAFVILLKTVIIPSGKYNKAVQFMEAGEYQNAILAFEGLEGYKDSESKIEICKSSAEDVKREKAYNDATSLMNEGKTIEAYEAFAAMGGYKDSEEKANSISDKYRIEKRRIANAGDYVKFGVYEQDNDRGNGKEEIEWLVLEKQENKILVISKYALDCAPYNAEDTDVTWETCTLRTWLNNTFLDAAFSETEKAIIQTVTVEAHASQKYDTNPGNNTQDKIFLLSINEADKYFDSDSARQCKPTAYAAANGVSYVMGDGTCSWRLRSSGYAGNYVADVGFGGGFHEHGDNVRETDVAVRPALWIDLNA